MYMFLSIPSIQFILLHLNKEKSMNVEVIDHCYDAVIFCDKVIVCYKFILPKQAVNRPVILQIFMVLPWLKGTKYLVRNPSSIELFMAAHSLKNTVYLADQGDFEP